MNTKEKINRFHKPKDGRTRIWTIIVYPDSAPDDWKEIVVSWGIEVYISPLHDKDTDNGELKKPHYHVIWRFGQNAKKSEKQIQELSDMLSGVRVSWERCAVPVLDAAVQYLAHYNNPEKAQYPIDEIEGYNGADVMACFQGAGSVDQHVGDMMRWVDDSESASFAELARYARDNQPAWFRTLTAKRTVFLKHYCTTVGWEREQLRKRAAGVDQSAQSCVICHKPQSERSLKMLESHKGEFLPVCEDCAPTFHKLRDENIKFIVGCDIDD